MQSSFISQFIDESKIGLIYGGAALLSIVFLVSMPRILRSQVDSNITLSLIIVEAIICLILAYSTVPIVIISAFILQQAILPIIFFTLDILIEHNSKDSETGHIRGRAFTATNLSLIVSPFLVGSIVSSASTNSLGYSDAYQLSLLLLIPLFILMYTIKKVDTKPIASHTGFIHVIKNLLSIKQKNVRMILMVNLLLQIFYTWMVIYSPIYLLQQGFTWSQMGLMFSIMLIPFIIFPLPLGILADSTMGHKKLLYAGLLVIGGATIAFGYATGTNVVLWTAILFMTRVGASFIELLSDSYFFKHITAKDIYTLAFFRLNRPASQLIAPALATGAMAYYGANSGYVYITLGIIVLCGIYFVYRLSDTTNPDVATQNN